MKTSAVRIPSGHPHVDPRIDAYIEKAAPFAQPILQHLRALVHRAAPDAVETMKWSFPHFDYKGPFCHMAAFTAHCTFGFWKATLLASAPEAIVSRDAMGNFGRITTLADLPADEVILMLLAEARDLNERGVKLPRPTAAEASARTLDVPAFITEALQAHPSARLTFDSFSYSNRKEYVEWVMEAKTDATRTTRLATMLAWLAEGKPRNWKYLEKKKK